MSSTRLLLTNNEANSSSENGVIIKDIVPHSMLIEDDCSCTCAFCPNVFDWCIKDALGLSGAIITWFLFLYGQFVIIFVILIPKNHSFGFNLFNLFLFHSLEFLAISSHCRTMFSNPGAVPLNNATPEKLLKYENGTIVYRCTTCQSIKPPRAHHCRVCKRCIKRMDHHCGFVNNCIGENNQKYFILFTFYTCVISLYAICLLSIHLPTCITSNWTACPAWSPPVTLFLLIIFGLIAFCFLMFTATMTGMQLYSIYTDTTGIEYYNRKAKFFREQKSFLTSLKTVFGPQIGLTWFNPFSKPIYSKTEDDEPVIFHA